MNSRYSPILHVCMHTRRGKDKFNHFQILLDIRCISTILMKRLITKLETKEDAVIKCHTQEINITTNIKVKIYFTFPKLIATKIVTWNCHVGDSAKVRYNVIFGRYILTVLVLNPEFSLNTSLKKIMDI